MNVPANVRKLLVALILAGLALPALLDVNIYVLHVLNLAWISAIAALGLNIATGITGQIVLGQAALMGIGSYGCALAMMRLDAPWWLALPAAMLLAAIVGAALGIVSVRIRGHYLAITTLALNEIFRLFLTNEEWLTGGPMGLRDIPTLDIPALGANLDRQLYLPLLAATIAVYAVTLRIYRGRLGRSMRAVRDDELAAEAMGVDSPRVKTVSFALCSAWAALAGGLYVLLVGFVSPNNFTIFESIRLLLMVVVGGLGSIGGTFLGALLITVLPEALRALETYYLAAFSLAVIAVLLFEPRGLGIVADWLLAPWLPGRRDGSATGEVVGAAASRPTPPAAPRPRGPDAEPVLRVHEVSKHFGGVSALDRVSLEVRPGEILGLIGPNGSGKSTLINACSGNVRPTSGEIVFAGTPLGGLPPWRVHALGIARIFQNVRLWPTMTVLENVMVACPAGGRPNAAGPREAALEALELIGIPDLAERQASDLSFGQSRLVELARAMVSRPRLLLLDEPAAGLRGGLVMELADVLRRLRDHGMSILVVEHRVKLVVSMCDRVVVLNLGKKIAEGAPAEVARDPLVVTAYLGDRIPGQGDGAAPAIDRA